ncbi:glycosyltransferase family 4 protein, partial [Anabaena sp. UHCC 0451]|uniref:glycosyltransferase family 4 protein n=1 Tax=Anabaena sp. UHCC 0451 TaxID=2055235 RepID=UPI002B21CC24
MKLATVWQNRGKPLQAIANYEKAIQLQPDYLPAYLNLVQLLVQTGQTQQAIDTYGQGIETAIAKVWFPPHQAREEYRKALKRRQEIGQAPRVLLYTNCPGTYGAEQISHALMLRLVNSGYQVICVQTQADHHLIQARQALGIKHIWLKDDAYQFGYTFGNALEVAEIVAATLPDLIIFADGNPLDDLAANWVAMSLQIPYIRVIHCVIPDWAKYYAPYLCLLPDIYRASAAVISVSHANLQLMREMFLLPENLGQVIYNGRPEDYFVPCVAEVRERLRQYLGIPWDGVVIFTAARMYPVKGYQHQVKAIAQLRQFPVWSKLYFVWAGIGTLETQLKTDLEELGVGERVKFLGERADIPDLLEAADIFLLPSHVEGMPLAIMEAMAKGLPVIATAISGIPEELGDTGKLLPDP